MARYVCAMLLKMKEVFQVIESMKRAAVIEDYAVAGAVGALFYVEPFSTAAIDFLVRLPLSNGLLVSLEPIHSWLLSKGYRMDSGGSFIVEKWPIQFLPVTDELSSEALREARYLPFEPGMDVRVIRAEHLAAERCELDARRINSEYLCCYWLTILTLTCSLVSSSDSRLRRNGKRSKPRLKRNERVD